MLEELRPQEGRDVSLDPIDIEADAIDEGQRRSSAILPPVSKLIRGQPIPAKFRASDIEQAWRPGSAFCAEELATLLQIEGRFQDSPTFLIRLAGMYRACGDTGRAIEFARRAASIAASAPFSHNLAEALLEGGDKREAEKIFQMLGEQGHVPSLLRLAEFAINNQDADQASIYINRAAEVDSEDWRVRLMAGTISLATENYEQAIRHYRAALGEKPNSSVVYLNLGIAYFLLGFPQKSAFYARAALGVNPWNRKALFFLVDVSLNELQGLDVAETALKRYLSLFEDDNQIGERLSDVFLREGKVDEGVRFLERFSRRFKNPTLLNNLGVFWTRKNKNRAGYYFNRAIEAAGGAAQVHAIRGAGIATLNLGHWLLENREFRQAEALLKRYFDSASDVGFLADEALSRIPLYLIRALALQDKYEEALGLATKLLSTTDVYVNTKIDLATAISTYHSFVSGDNEAAVRYARIAYQLSAEMSEKEEYIYNRSLNNLAFVLLESDAIEEAGSFIQRLRTDTDLPEYPYATRGLFWLKKGNLEKGIASYRKSVAVAHGVQRKNAIRQKMNLEVGIYWFRRGELSRAKGFFQKALKGKSARDVWPMRLAKEKAEKFLEEIRV